MCRVIALLLFFAFISCSHAMFLVKIGDFVWEDLNKNGVQDYGEPGVANIPVYYDLFYQGNIVYSGSTITDSNGYYYFYASHHEVMIYMKAPNGYEITNPLQGNNFMLNSDFDSNGNLINKIIVDNIYPIYGPNLLFYDMGLIKKTDSGHPNNCRTIGFWKNNIKKAIDNKNGMQVNKEDLISWLYKINQYYLEDPFALGLSDEEILRNSYNILYYKGADIRFKTMRQLIACELNLLSEEFSLQDIGFHDQLCRQAEDALYNNNIKDLYELHDKLDWVNNQ